MMASSYGYVAPSDDPRVVLEVLAEAVERAGCADVMAFALDCASSEVYDDGLQTYALNGERVTAGALIDRGFLAAWALLAAGVAFCGMIAALRYRTIPER